MRKIPLGGNSTRVALVDDEDYDRLAGLSWYEARYGRNVYARSAGGQRRQTALKMHRVVLNLGPGDPMVDHIDGDGLNNQKSNLRLVTASQNQQNSWSWAGKGVTRSTGKGRWKARVLVDGKRVHLGTFDSKEEAAAAYATAASKYFGEYARADGPDELIETKH